MSSDAIFRITNGKLSVSAVTTNNMQLINTNGNVEVSCSSCYSVLANDTNGNIAAILTSPPYTGSYGFTTVNGNVDLKIPSAISAKITCNTVNGSVSSSGFPVQFANHVTSTIGAGTGVVTARTTNGSISITGT
jgi:DUF4097 and DUF4098 domain-containing protein YvlB